MFNKKIKKDNFLNIIFSDKIKFNITFGLDEL